MNWLLILLVSAFAIVTVVLGVVCSCSPEEKRHQRKPPADRGFRLEGDFDVSLGFRTMEGLKGER